MCARYYPNGSNRPKNPDNPLSPGRDNNTALENNDFARWLYGEGHEWDTENLNRFRMLYAVEPTKSYIDYLLDLRTDAEYISRYGISPGDINDPRKLRSVGSGARAIASGLNFVSDNVRWLYK